MLFDEQHGNFGRALSFYTAKVSEVMYWMTGCGPSSLRLTLGRHVPHAARTMACYQIGRGREREEGGKNFPRGPKSGMVRWSVRDCEVMYCSKSSTSGWECAVMLGERGACDSKSRERSVSRFRGDWEKQMRGVKDAFGVCDLVYFLQKVEGEIMDDKR